jgi:cysteine desulfurase
MSRLLASAAARVLHRHPQLHAQKSLVAGHFSTDADEAVENRVKSAHQEMTDSSSLRPLYLDAQSTTPLDPRVLDAMMPYLTSLYGNPHSRTHKYGWESEDAMEQARSDVASVIGADPKEIVFTSGATESNNISVKGVARFYKAKKNHVITTQTEHKCVLDSCRQLEAEGFKVTYLPVQQTGRIDLEELENTISKETSLVSIMTVNNEIGVVQPMKEIGEMCRKNKASQCIFLNFS